MQKKWWVLFAYPERVLQSLHYYVKSGGCSFICVLKESISTVCIKFVLLDFQKSQMKGYFLDQLGIRIGHNVEQNGRKRACVQKQKACSGTPAVKTEPHGNENELLFLGIIILLLDTSVQVRHYAFHLQNDIKPPEGADKKVTPELKATHTCRGSTIIKPVCHAERSGFPVWVCCWEGHTCPAFGSWQYFCVLCCTILGIQQLAVNSHTAPCVGFCSDVQQIYPGYPKSFTSGLHVFLWIC